MILHTISRQKLFRKCLWLIQLSKMPLKTEACRAKFMKIELRKKAQPIEILLYLSYFGGLYDTTISEFLKIDKEDTLCL